jgi:DNA-binding NarL/FixJ family response regulator
MQNLPDPSRVTKRQSDALDAYLCTGSWKRAALHIGVSTRTMEQHLRNARHRMRVQSHVHMIVEWTVYRTAAKGIG